jgi:peptidoglycan/xylan/chitin deacetylase (PgdA/CDA1 family)
LSHTLRTARSWSRPGIVILGYHRVVPLPDEQAYPFDPELISASCDEFDWQIRYLKRYMEPISLPELAACIEQGVRPPRRAVAITFDDGFDDNYLNAFPILREHGVPATFFVSTDYIGTERTFWFDHVVNCVLNTESDEIALPTGATMRMEADKERRRLQAYQLLEQLKSVPNARRLAYLDEMKAWCTAPAASAPSALSRAMTWEQISEMARAGMDIGSHTASHPVLSQCTEEEIRSELTESKEAIETRTGQAVVSLAYPVGSAQAIDRRVIQAARECGYGVACTYITGNNPVNELTDHRFQLRRSHVERYLDRDYFSAMTVLPEWF